MQLTQDEPQETVGDNKKFNPELEDHSSSSDGAAMMLDDVTISDPGTTGHTQDGNFRQQLLVTAFAAGLDLHDL